MIDEYSVKKFDRIEAVFHEVLYAGRHDPNLISELVRLTWFMDKSIRRWELDLKIKHYATLTQSAAKEKLWRKIYDIAYGFHTEVYLAKNRIEQSVQ